MSISPTIPFNPLTMTLNPNERLRIRNGQLFKEDITLRDKKCWLIRLFTRKQYSQSRILEKMGIIATRAMLTGADRATTHNIIQNQGALLTRARNQNLKYMNKSPITRLILDKKLINLTPHNAILVSLSHHYQSFNQDQTRSGTDLDGIPDPDDTPDFDNIPDLDPASETDPSTQPKVDAKETVENIWENDFDDDLAVAAVALGNTGFPYPNSVLVALGLTSRIDPYDNKGECLDILFKALGLQTVGDWKAKGLYNHDQIAEYFEKNKQTLIDRLKANEDARELFY